MVPRGMPISAWSGLGMVHRLLNQDAPWAAVAAIADNLLAHDTLEGEDVEEIVYQWISKA